MAWFSCGRPYAPLGVIRNKKTRMVVGDLGRFLFDVIAKIRMLWFWYKVVDPFNAHTFSSIACWFTHKLYANSKIHSECY